MLREYHAVKVTEEKVNAKSNLGKDLGLDAIDSAMVGRVLIIFITNDRH